MMNKKNMLALVIAAALLTGCARTAPVENINQSVSQSYTDNQMQNAIIQAGIGRKWIMTPAGPGVVNGRLSERGHVAEIRVTYTANTYHIQYVGSQGLMASGGQIHRNYNRWVHNLDQDIQLRLASLAAK